MASPIPPLSSGRDAASAASVRFRLRKTSVSPKGCDTASHTEVAGDLFHPCYPGRMQDQGLFLAPIAEPVRVSIGTHTFWLSDPPIVTLERVWIEVVVQVLVSWGSAGKIKAPADASDAERAKVEAAKVEWFEQIQRAIAGVLKENAPQIVAQVVWLDPRNRDEVMEALDTDEPTVEAFAAWVAMQLRARQVAACADALIHVIGVDQLGKSLRSVQEKLRGAFAPAGGSAPAVTA